MNFATRSNEQSKRIEIKVIGVGGAGVNSIDRIQLENLRDLSFVAMNTDAQALDSSTTAERHLLGATQLRGLGAGGDASIGMRAAEAERAILADVVAAQDIVIIVAGLGGGTGSGAAPVIAQEAAKAGATIIAFVTLPFSFEGRLRKEQAEEALHQLRKVAHAVIPLPNDILMQQLEGDASVMQAFALADTWIARGIEALAGLIRKTGLINVDFSTLQRAFPVEAGKTLFGIGEGSGTNAMKLALEGLCLCPLLHLPQFAKRVDTLVVNITGGPSLSLAQVNQAMTTIADKFGGRDNTIMGAVVDEDLSDTIRICILGTTDVSSKTTDVTSSSAFSDEEQATNPSSKQEGELLTPADSRKRNKVEVNRPVHQSKLQGKDKGKKRSRFIDDSQEEFSFFDEAANRGAFDNSERNFYDDQDLDVPTFMRLGLKVAL